MSRRKRQTAAVLAGAVVLASGAYAIGSTSGDGSATAKKSGSSASARGDGRRGPHGPDLAALAKALGVETADLRAALEDIRASRKPPSGDPRDGFIKDFAAAIGLPEDKVRAAFESVGPPKGAPRRGKRFRRGPHGPMGGPPPGGPMGGPPPPGGPGGPGGPPPPDGRRGRHVGPPADVVSKLAKALGVEEADVKAAFEKLRTKHEAEETARRDEFASDLAKRLGLDVQKVKDALESVRPHDGRRERH
ncbi:MAG TPA: Clp protease N-terminal domain-containing protein [Thermoleophilaceae bacterium]|jgi:hypothetical protein